MDNQAYLKDPVDRVLEVLRDAFGDRFREYVNGLMDREIPSSMLPLIMATSSDGDIEAGATGTDDITEKIVIILVINQKDYEGAGGTASLADVELRHRVMGQDPTTRQYLPGTVMYAIRKNFTLEDGVVGNRVTFDFAPVQRGNDLYTQEAAITLNIRRMALVPSRS